MHEVRDAVDAFAERVRSGEHRGATGKVLKNVVVVGIGGSSLGPAFLYEALKATPLYSRLGGREVPPTSRKAPRTHRVPHRTRNAPHAHRTRTAARTARTAHRCTRAPHTRTAHAHQIRFLANIDEVDTARAIAQLDAAETLVVVTSKSFATRETLINACTLRQWLIEELSSGDDGISAAQITATHIAACTCVPEAASCWGIAPELAFPFWDWVGGRYSVTSCVGHLPIALAFGGGVFDEFLEGRPPQAERGRPGPVPLVSQLALSPGLLELACQAPGRAMHSKRAAGPLGAQWEAAVRPCGPAKLADSAAFPPCSCHAMDTHFTTAPPERNLPMMMGLLGVWNANFLNLKTRAVFPYCEALWRLPSHIQQVRVEYTRAGRIGCRPVAYGCRPSLDARMVRRWTWSPMASASRRVASLSTILWARSTSASPAPRDSTPFSSSCIWGRWPYH